MPKVTAKITPLKRSLYDSGVQITGKNRNLDGELNKAGSLATARKAPTPQNKSNTP